MEPDEIKLRREALGMSQAELAEALYVAANTIARWECGVHRPSKNLQRQLQQYLEEREQHADY